jgi:hypothetical protein
MCHYAVPEYVRRFWLAGVPSSLSLKNLPDGLHARVAAAARCQRRSFSETIVCLEAGFGDKLSRKNPLAQSSVSALRQVPIQWAFDRRSD